MVKKRVKKQVSTGIAHIQATLNNTTIAITDLLGQTLCWSSGGIMGFKGSRKSTSFAAQCVAQNVVSKALEFGIKKIDIIVKGCGFGRENAINTLKNEGLTILSIEDRTSLAHNGCRPLKKRRI